MFNKQQILRFLKSKKFIYICIFVFFCILCFLFPYSHDDWAWGSSVGIERLKNHFDNYNGRWFGNFVVLLLTRNKLLKTLVMAGVLTCIIILIDKIVESDKKMTTLLSFLLILAMPVGILMQGVVWTSGFSNYVVSILLVLIFINCNKWLFKDKSKKDNKVYSILLLILGFITSLFIEHLTIYCLILSFGILVYTLIKYKKVYFEHISYFVGNLCGVILMFSNSAYSSVASGTDGYRSFEFGNFISASIKSYFEVIYKELIYNNHVLNLILTMLVLLILIKKIRINKDNNKKILANLIGFILIVFTIYSILTSFNNINLLLKYTDYFNGIFTMVFCIALLMFVIFFIDSKSAKRRMIFTLISIVVMTLPLFVVTPIGSRCFFPMYTLLVLFVADLMNCLLKTFNYKDVIHSIEKILISLIFIFGTYLLLVYGYIYKVYSERLNYIDLHNGDEVIVLPKLPYKEYVWLGNPANDGFLNQFKNFYKIDRDSKLKFVSIKQWKKIINSTKTDK